MSDVEILRGIGIPPEMRGRKPGFTHASKYPFNDLDVGDGFITSTARGSISSLITRWGRRTDRRFTSRKQPDGRILVVRVS